MTSKPGKRYNGHGVGPPPPLPPLPARIDLRFGPLDGYEQGAMGGQDTSDWVSLILPTVGAPQIQIEPTSGTVVMHVVFALPTGTFEGQAKRGLCGPDGQPVVDLSKWLAPILPMIRILVKRSGLSEAIRNDPVVAQIPVVLAELPPPPSSDPATA